MELCRAPRTWIAAVEDAAYAAGLRAHGRRNLLAVGWRIARSPTRGATRTPGHDELALAAQLSGRTITRWVTWLMSQGLLGRVSAGRTATWTAMHRPMALSVPSAANERAVYVLCVPVAPMSVDESGDPSCTPQVVGIHTRGRSKKPLHLHPDHTAQLTQKDGPTGPAAAKEPAWPKLQPARTRRDRLELVERLRAESSTLRAIHPRLLRHLLRPWLVAGWTVSGIQHALDHPSPDVGGRWTYTWDGPEALRNPAGWVWWRLRHWLGPDGRPRRDEVAAAQQRAAAQHRADLERRARAHPPLPRPVNDLPADYRAARAALRTKRLFPPSSGRDHPSP